MGSDLRQHVVDMLGCNLDDLMVQLKDKLNLMIPIDEAEINTGDTRLPFPSAEQGDGEGMGADRVPDAGAEWSSNRSTSGREDEVSGFFRDKDGNPPTYTNTKFWNYVDDSLKKMRKKALDEADSHEEAEKLYTQYVLMLNHPGPY
jgi:hypothetical protein